MPKVLRYGLRILAGLLLLWLILLAVAFLYYTTHKRELTARTNDFLNERFKGQIHIRDISLNLLASFPYPSLQVNEVTIDDSVYARQGRHTVYLERVRIVPSLHGIRKVVLENGSFYLYRDTSGYYNGYVWASRKAGGRASPGGEPVLPGRVEVRAVGFVLADSVRHKLYNIDVHHLFLDRVADTVWRMDLRVLVHSLSFKTYKGSFVGEQLVDARGEIGFSALSKKLAFNGLNLEIASPAGQPYAAATTGPSGAGRQAVRADGEFHFDSTHVFRLHFAAPSLDFAAGRSWLPWKISRKLDSLNFERPLAVDAAIEGVLEKGGEPRLLVRWQVAHNKVSGYIGSIEDCSFTGFFNNHIRDSLPPGDDNSVVRADSVTGKYEGSIPILSRRMEIVRLDSAVLVFDLSVHNPVSDWGDLIQSEDVSFDKGRVDMEVRCRYPLSDDLGPIPEASGDIRISDAEINYEPRNVGITNGQVHLRLDRQDLVLDRISGNIGESPVVVTGVARHFIAQVATDTGKMVLDWKVYSPALDGTSLLPFLGKGGRHGARRASGGPGRLLDRFIRRCRINTDLQVDKLTYKHFTATDVTAALQLDRGVLSLPRLSLNTAKGRIDVSGSIRPKGDDNEVRLKAVFAGIDLPTLFYAFDDFGQASLASKNISGTFNAQADLSLALTDKGRKVPGSLNGSLQFSIDNGALLDFSPLTKLSSFAFKNRDFSHVYFSKLFDTFQFSRDTANFGRMEIQSTVLEMFVAGAYKLDGTYTNADIQVPFNNLKKRKGLPENVGVDVGHGLSIYVHAFNQGDEPLHYKFGLFKKKTPGVK